MPLTITVLVENHSPRSDLRAGRGLCLHLDDGENRVLFDTGPDGRLIDNAATLGIDLARLTHVVLSHGHYDHSGGLPTLAKWNAERGLRPRLIMHPAAFAQRSARLGLGKWSIGLRELGAPFDPASLIAGFEIETRRELTPIGEHGLFYLGEIHRVIPFEQRKSFGWLHQSDGFAADYVADDSALAWHSPHGLVVISGCAHSGICNVVEHARVSLNASRVQAVLGGFHLRTAGPGHLGKVRRYFQQLAPDLVAACHCTGWGRYWLPGQQALATGACRIFH